jgi:hypothetical protein
MTDDSLHYPGLDPINNREATLTNTMGYDYPKVSEAVDRV